MTSYGSPQGFPETEYRKKIQEIYDLLNRAFEDVDPDLAECEQSMGSLTLTFGDKTRCILSAQPSVRQLWVALASQGTAFHFNFDPISSSWKDDKGKGIELLGYLEQFLAQKTGLKLDLKPAGQ